MLKAAAFVLATMIPLTAYAVAFSTVEREVVGTAVDSDFETVCEYGRVITGLSGGFGHSSTYNEPHNIECSTIKSAGGDVVVPSGNCFLRQTLVDNPAMVACPDNAVMVGFTGGFGHSSKYNTPHNFRCCGLAEGLKTVNHFSMLTAVDNDMMSACPAGFAMTGVSGGSGHSSKINEPHTIRCSELVW